MNNSQINQEKNLKKLSIFRNEFFLTDELRNYLENVLLIEERLTKEIHKVSDKLNFYLFAKDNDSVRELVNVLGLQERMLSDFRKEFLNNYLRRIEEKIIDKLAVVDELIDKLLLFSNLVVEARENKVRKEEI